MQGIQIMSILRSLRLQETQIVPIVSFMDHFAFDADYLIENYLDELATCSKIYGFHQFDYNNPRFENLPNGQIKDNTAIVADIDLETLPLLTEMADAHKYFDFNKELVARIKKSMADASMDISSFNANDLNNSIEEWEPLWVVTYIWLLVSCRMIFTKLVTFDVPSDYPIPTEIEAMEQVLAYTVAIMTEFE